MATLILPFRPADFTLAGTLRAVNDANGTAQRIELAPQSAMVDSDFDTTATASGSTLGANWTVANLANASAIDANTSLKSRLSIQGNNNTSDWYQTTVTGPFVYQIVSGDFDVWSHVGLSDIAGTAASPPTGVRLQCQDATIPANWWSILFGARLAQELIWEETNGGTTQLTVAAIGKHPTIGEPMFLRLKRASGVFTAYYALLDTIPTWTQISNPATTYTSTNNIRLGIAVTQNVASTLYASADFILNWPPFNSASPVASVVIDSGLAGATWNMASFIGIETVNPGGWRAQIGFGTVRYQYGASDTNPPSLNGSDLTLASMQAQGNPTGRYFKLQVKFTATNGYEFTSFAGGSIQATIGVAPTYSSY